MRHDGTGRQRRRTRSAALWGYALTALLGVSGRRAVRPPRERAWQDAASSSAEAPDSAANPLQFGRAYQLPPFGRGNGLDALFWAPLAELPAPRTAAVLDALAGEDIPGWVAPVARVRRIVPPPADAPHDLWVAAAQLDRAQDVLVRVLAD